MPRSFWRATRPPSSAATRFVVDGGLTAQLQDDIAYRMTEWVREEDARQ